ncbi:MAG: TetR/AcrR family transcriptional regulator [Bacteroidia bacterium]|nr:TetR/AcrR family transcriptional regulator [Bacteroidia bacterium]MBT8230678.1 TetR/AcrR family transcriptional regulator [Bacteroidia bacterium]NNK90188.1 TetR family transcriptional regulator [Saprospiraceae bacterium]
MRKKDKHIKFREEILKLFHTKGYRATTMRDIAGQMEFEVANVYNYIESKQLLLQELLFEMVDIINTSLEDILDSSYSTLEKVKHIISLHCQIPAERPYQISLISNEWKNLEEEKMTEFLNAFKWHTDQITELIKKGMDEGIIRQAEPYIMTRTFLSCFNWLYTEYPARRKEINPIEIEKQISEFVLRSMFVEYY